METLPTEAQAAEQPSVDEAAEQAPAADQAPPDATPEPHPGHAILDEMVRTSQVQMNRSWLLRKIDDLRRTL